MADLSQHVTSIAERGDHSFLPLQIAIHFSQMVLRQAGTSYTVSADVPC